jgi:hypothetical protein
MNQGPIRKILIKLLRLLVRVYATPSKPYFQIISCEPVPLTIASEAQGEIPGKEIERPVY